jgi:hypothetical protein
MLSAAAAIVLLAGPATGSCLADQPMVALASLGGLGAQPSGLLVAVWSDGRILRVTTPVGLTGGYSLGRLKPAEVEALAAFIEASRVTTADPGPRYIDYPERRLAFCRGGRRLVVSEATGGDPESPLGLVARHLMQLDLTNTSVGRAPGLWIRWFAVAESE